MIHKSLNNLTSIKPLALFATTLISTAGALNGLTSVAYAETAKSADAFVDTIGVNMHLGYTNTAYGNYDNIIKPKLQELGVRHIRDGAYQTQDFIDKVKDLSNLGIKSTLYFNGNSPSDVVAIAKMFQGAIVAVESTNESDLPFFEFSYNGQGFPEGTRAYQNDLYAAIKGDPATAYLPVLMPSMGWGENAQRVGYLENGDFGNMHSYPNLGNPPTDSIDSYFIYHARSIAGSTKPLMSTEAGYHTFLGDELGVSESVSAKYIPRLLLEYFNRDIRRTFLYEFIEQRAERDNSRESYFGLLRSNGSPKPAYTAVKNLITLLKEPGANFNPGDLDYTLSGDTTDVHHTLLQKSNGTFYLVLWQEVKSWDNQNKNDIAVGNREVTLNLNTAISSASVYQPHISTNPTQSTSPNNGRLNNLTLSVPDAPMVVELRI